MLDRIIRTVCRLFGGATVYAAKGCWFGADGEFFTDDVNVVTSSATEPGEARDALRALARDVLSLTDQQAVFISVDGTAEIITE